MFNYLYYKIYQSVLTGSYRDTPHITTSILMGCLLGINILEVYIILVKLDVIGNALKSKVYGGLLIAILIGLDMLYFGKSRREAILEKYSEESDDARIRGNVIVGVYAVLSFLSIFLVAGFKPGKF